ncbi:MAG: hypothetical protein KA319_06555 [Ferruginibacter sp.]|nr:hypothetical protein [Ferruginibacter sp.]
MKLLFTNGIKRFGLLRLFCSDQIADGIVVTYTDNNNKNWHSKNINISDIFEQISLTDKKSIDGLYEKDWKARFSCKLYDDIGNSINAENCEIFGPVFSF